MEQKETKKEEEKEGEENMTKRFNKKKIYQCPKCKEWFRLKMSLNLHKCKMDFKRRINV